LILYSIHSQLSNTNFKTAHKLIKVGLYILRPRRTWLRTIEQDLRPLNIGLVSACQRAQDRERRKRTVETATLQDGACSWWWWWWVGLWGAKPPNTFWCTLS